MIGHITFAQQESYPWLLAAGSLADSNTVSGNVPQSSQSFDGQQQTLSIQPGGQSFANAYWYKKRETSDFNAACSFEYSMDYQFPSLGESNAVQALEMDVQQVISGVVYNWGIQLDYEDNQIRVWNRSAGAWVPAGLTCSRDTSKHSIVWSGIRSGATIVYGHSRLDAGEDLCLGLSFPSTALANPDTLNNAIQLDGNNLGQPTSVVVSGVTLVAQ